MKVQWTRTAVQYPRDLQAYIAADSTHCAQRYANRILACTRKLGSFPRPGRKVLKAGTVAIGEIIVRPYRIIYRLTQDRILIWAVIHASRDLSGKNPKPWEIG